MKFTFEGEVFNVVTQKRIRSNTFDYIVIVGERPATELLRFFERKDANVYVYGDPLLILYEYSFFIKENAINKLLDDFDTLQEISE